MLQTLRVVKAAVKKDFSKEKWIEFKTKFGDRKLHLKSLTKQNLLKSKESSSSSTSSGPDEKWHAERVRKTSNSPRRGLPSSEPPSISNLSNVFMGKRPSLDFPPFKPQTKEQMKADAKAKTEARA